MSLCVYDFLVHNLSCRCSDIVHPADPRHLVICLELFRHALALGHLLNRPGELHFGLLVNVRQAAARLAVQQQTVVAGLAVLPDIPQMPLTPQTDGLSFLFW